MRSCIYFYLLMVLSRFAIAEAQDILILRGDGNYPPNEMMVGEKPGGYHIELIEEVAKIMKIKVQIKSYPWSRAQKLIQDGQADAITYIGRSPEREQYLYFDDRNILSVTTNKLIGLRDSSKKIKFNGDLEQLVDYRIGVLAGYTYGDKFDHHPKIKKVAVDQMRQFFPMLSAKYSRIDFAVVNVDDCINEFRNIANFSDYAFVDGAVSSVNNYIAFSKKKGLQVLSDEFAKAFDRFRLTPRYQDLQKKYEKL